MLRTFSFNYLSIMFQIEKTIVSEEIITEDFVCNLSACKGACCVEGEAGAPLETGETKLLEKDYDAIAPFLNEAGKKSIQKNGKFVKGSDGDWETPLVNDKECSYVVFTSNGGTQCGIENAYKAGKINWKKPISCHLYPVRVRSYSEFSAVNYHQWHICSSACELGASLKVPVYKFAKEALIRKFGEKWYQELEETANDLKKRAL